MYKMLSFLLYGYIFHVCFCMDLTYYVEEDKGPGTYLGDVAADTHLMDSVLSEHQDLIHFSQLQQSVTGSSSQLFRIAKKTGKLYTAQTLDAETLCKRNIECFQIVKIAVRRSKTFLQILKIKVIVKDVNDHQPEFPESEISVQFSEADGEGINKLIPNAIDKDVGVLNSQITYELKKNLDDPFSLLLSKSGDGTSDLSIKLEDKLDREVKDSYMVQVVAKDGGSPPKESVLDVHISVTDINDNTPVFSQKVYNVSIRFEHDEIIPVATISARDLDTGENGKVSYYFTTKTSDMVKAYFKVNEVTGEIFLQKKFTSGQELVYKLYVKATDGGTPPLSSNAMVLVNVINQKNNAPSIDVNFISASTENNAAISEDVGVGSFIAYVMVTDPDSGPNGEVSCDLNHEIFQLQSLGTKEYKITVRKPVDREVEDNHEITISCQDKGSPPLISERQFSIQVMDVNDVKPQFSKERFKFLIYENQKSKFPVGSIHATDPDLGAGGKLTYSLLNNDNNFLPFQITDDGLISTVMSLDYEFQDMYNFKVFVKDSGLPSLNSTVNVTVEVRDQNDNAPYFTYPSVNPFTLDVIYYPHQGNNITVLKATDSDSRENAFLKYEITGGNDKQLFTINPYNGVLSFTRVVIQQDAGLYDLQFVVKDSGTPVLSATTDLSLKLTVSNKTVEMLNAVHMKSDDSVQLYLMIVVVLVAVTLSVPITAAISLCVLRCRDKKNAAHQSGMNPSCKCTTEHGHYNCPSQTATLWSGVPVSLTTDSAVSGNTLSRSRRGPHPRDEFEKNQKDSTSGLRPQAPSDFVYQVSNFFCL